MSTRSSRKPPPDSVSTDKHTLFTQWSLHHGVQINNVKPQKIPTRGLGLIATSPIKSGDRILFIPEAAMYKPDDTILQREKLSHASPQAQLAVSAMLDFRDEESPFKVWIDTWPTYEDFKTSMPMCWSQDLQSQLPRSAIQPLERQLADYHKDWSVCQRSCDRLGIDEEEFKYYWMIVNSRSFHWRAPRSRAGSMVMCPFIDYINHGPTGSTCRVTMTAKGYEVKAERDYGLGEEIFATYSAHSNDKLLIHYGFILPSSTQDPNPDDGIRIDHLLLPALPTNILPQLQDTGFLGNYALLPATNELCFKTQVAVRAALLTCNEWEYFVACGEDITEDKTVEVLVFVKELLLEWCDEVRRGIEVGGMVGARWRQILDAIGAFNQMCIAQERDQ